MKFILESTSKEYELMGGKATALAKMGMSIDNIPSWFVLSYTGFDKQSKDISQEALSELKERVSLLEDGYYAVRSSASNEDSTDNSFAGQFETFLYVPKDEIINKVKEVYLSAYSSRVEQYRKENNIDEISIPSVIVQKQINSEMAGVAFGANPVNGNIKQIVVNAVYGLGSSLVDGEATADTYILTGNKIDITVASKDFYHEIEDGKVINKKIPNVKKNRQVLKDSQIREVARLVKLTSKYFGRYQDIEWAYEKDKLYLLQSRPITTLGNLSNKDEKINVFDNSNIVESYGGITTPLTFSFIRTVYESVYIELCKIFKIEQEKIELNSQMFKNLLGLIDGRVYYNLYGWYGILTMFPGLGKNKKFMEQMMGVKESLPDSLFPVPQDQTFKDKIELLNAGLGLVGGYKNLRKMTEDFYSRLNEALSQRDLDNMDLYELHDYYYELERKLLYKWDAPLVNDFLAMIFYGKLKQKCIKLFGQDGEKIHNDLLCSDGDIISAEPAKRIKEMATIVSQDDTLIEVLKSGDNYLIQKEIQKNVILNTKLQEYLDKFSDRCLQELKLETMTLKDDPSNLYRSILVMAQRIKEGSVEENDTEKTRREAEEKLKKKLRFRIFEKRNVNFILKNARYTVRNRENLRFERTRVFGRVREIFLRIGFILASMNVIENKRDIFYLEVNEILFYIDGKSTTNNLKELIKIRKEQYEKYNQTSPDDRFYSHGAVNVGNDFKKQELENKTTNENKQTQLSGVGASPGIVRGKVRVVRDPKNAKIKKGEILVAEFTDPGWIMLFPAAKGVLVERGSLLSHSAIVSRELGIPAIVGITGLLENVQDGDIVEMDGKTGIVKITEDEKRRPNSIKQLIDDAALFCKTNILYEIGKDTITYGEAKNLIMNLAISLEDKGCLKKPIVIFAENRYEYELLELATMYAGGTVVLLDREFSKEKIQEAIKNTNGGFVFTSKQYKNRFKNIVSESKVFEFESIDFKRMLDEQEKNRKQEFEKLKINPLNTAIIMYTSGTTGKSKIAMLSQKSICNNLYFSVDYIRTNEKDNVLSVMPLSHSLEGIFTFYNSIYGGAKRTHSKGIENIIEEINTKNITFMSGVPVIFEYLKEHLDEITNKDVLFFSAGAPLNEKTQKEFIDKGFTLIQGYGMTEACPAISLDTKDELRIGSCGRPLDNIDLKIENDKNGELGALYIRSTSMFNGYIGTNTQDYIKDGWFNTGDLARFDADGYLYISGRSKDVIVLPTGQKVVPNELEKKVKKIPEVRQVYIYEEKVSDSKSIVAAEINCNVRDKEIVSKKIDDLNEKLAEFEKITKIRFTNRKLTNGRNTVKETIVEKELAKAKKPEKKTSDVLNRREVIRRTKAIISKQLGITTAKVKNDANLKTELIADSFDKITILTKLEKEFELKIEKKTYKELNTVKELVDYICSKVL